MRERPGKLGKNKLQPSSTLRLPSGRTSGLTTTSITEGPPTKIQLKSRPLTNSKRKTGSHDRHHLFFLPSAELIFQLRLDNPIPRHFRRGPTAPVNHQSTDRFYSPLRSIIYHRPFIPIQKRGGVALRLIYLRASHLARSLANPQSWVRQRHTHPTHSPHRVNMIPRTWANHPHSS